VRSSIAAATAARLFPAERSATGRVLPVLPADVGGVTAAGVGSPGSPQQQMRRFCRMRPYSRAMIYGAIGRPLFNRYRGRAIYGIVFYEQPNANRGGKNDRYDRMSRMPRSRRWGY